MSLPSKNRLRSNKDFDHLFKNGKTIKGHFLLAKYTEAHGTDPKIGFIVPAKVAKLAVARNKLKRVLANQIQGHLNKINKDAIILVLKLPDKKFKPNPLLEEMVNIIKQIT